MLLSKISTVVTIIEGVLTSVTIILGFIYVKNNFKSFASRETDNTHVDRGLELDLKKKTLKKWDKTEYGTSTENTGIEGVSQANELDAKTSDSASIRDKYESTR